MFKVVDEILVIFCGMPFFVIVVDRTNVEVKEENHLI